MARRLLTATVLVLATGTTGVAAAVQKSVEVSATEGTVSATLTYRQSTHAAVAPLVSDLQLQISRAGVSVFATPVHSHFCEALCGLERFGTGPLRVKDLEADGQPNVVVELNTGGDHCCTVVQVYTYDPGASTYRVSEHDFGDPGALLTDVAGDERVELESADDRFAYAFTSFAFSGLPLQIWRFAKGQFSDATREFPQAIAADAKRQWGGFLANRRRGLGLGFIAAWAADEELLGNHGAVADTLAREARLRHLRSGDHLSPGGTRFVRKLQRFLLKTGYAQHTISHPNGSRPGTLPQPTPYRVPSRST